MLAEQKRSDGRARDAILAASGVLRKFGGLTAVDVERIEIGRGAITSLIGPNGAGKSTLFNVLTRFDKAQAGHWALDGCELTNVPAHRIAEMGLVRTFQLTACLSRLTVLENMMLGAQNQTGESLWAALWPPGWRRQEAEIEERAHALIERFKLKHMVTSPAGILSGGQRKLLEMARALMAEPKLLLLDEPMAGVNPALRDSLLEHIRDSTARAPRVLIIEHDMELVRRISDHVICMAEGKVVAEGHGRAVANDRP